MKMMHTNIDVLSALAKDNRPPFEHEDIAALCNALDDVVDMVQPFYWTSYL